VWDDAVDCVRYRRAGRTASLIARAEHEVVDHELRAAVEQLRQRARAVVCVEAVLLLDSDPGQLAPLPCQLVTQAGVLLLASEQLRAAAVHSSRLTTS
jgi:hypothetical protein